MGKYPSYPTADALDGSEVLVLVQGGATRKATTQDIADLGGGGGGGIESVVAGASIDVDVTDPDNPVVAFDPTEVPSSSFSIAQTSGLQAALDGKEAAGAAATVGAALAAHESDTTAVHGIADTSALLDTGDIGTSVQGYDADLAALASAGNSSVLAATTASFLTADETKLDGIEALADVTDATNVAAAGAVMGQGGTGGTAQYLWIGTESEYAAIGAPNARTVYVVTEDP